MRDEGIIEITDEGIIDLTQSDASKTSGDQAPVLVSTVTTLSAAGTATVSATYPSAGSWYVIARWYDASGAQAGSFVQAATSLMVVDCELPTVGAVSIPKLIPSVQTQCSLTLTGTNTASITTANIKITIGATLATGLTYAPTTGVASYCATKSLRTGAGSFAPQMAPRRQRRLLSRTTV